MTAAVYARKSTDQFGVTHEARSVTRRLLLHTPVWLVLDFRARTYSRCDGSDRGYASVLRGPMLDLLSVDAE
jgi:hypothetical protein